MNVEYIHYEKNKNLEEIQAEIFNENMKKYGSNLATADEIKVRYEAEGFDAMSVSYAFTDKKKPLAYIQTRIDRNNNRTFVGYPWALPECPLDVQQKLFEDMLTYIKSRDQNHKIVLGNVQENWKEVHTFVKKYNAILDNEFNTYVLEVSKMIALDDHDFTMKIATPEDDKYLIELAKAEPNFDTAFADEQTMENYLKDQIKNKEVLFVYKGDLLVSAGTLNSLEPDQKGIVNIRFTATREYKFEYWRAFVIELSKYLHQKGLKNASFTIFDRQPEHLKFYDQYGKIASVSTMYEIPK